MKYVVIIILLLCCCGILPQIVYADDMPGADILQQTINEVNKADDSLTIFASDSSGSTVDLNTGVVDIFNTKKSGIMLILKRSMTCCAKLLIIGLLCSIVTNMAPNNDERVKLAVNATGGIAILTVAGIEMTGIISAGTALVREINVFSKTLMPTLTAAAAAAGAPASALARSTITMAAGDIIITIMSSVFLPLTSAVIGLRAVSALTGTSQLDRLCGFIKTFTINTLKILLTIYFAYITISGIIGGTADTLARKTVKTTVSTAIPIVGGIIAEAADSVFAGASVIKSSLGVVGLLGAIALCALPVASAGINYLMLRITAALSAIIGENGGTSVIDGLADGMSMIFAMVSAATAMLVVSVVSFLV